MKSLFIASILVTAFAVIQHADARPRDMKVRHHQSAMEIVNQLKGLSLTTEQKAQIKTLLVAFRENNVRPEPPQKYLFDDKSEAEILALVQENIETQHSQRFATAALHNAIFTLLTQAQQSLLAERPVHEESKIPSARDKVSRLPFSELALTDEQKASLELVLADFKDQQQQQRSVMESFRNAENALIYSTDFSRSAWQALQLQYRDDLVDAMVQNILHKQSMLNLLTDDQRADLKAQREEQEELRRLFTTP